MGVRIVLLAFLISSAFAQTQPQPQFNMQLLGYDPVSQKIVILNIDTRSVTIDRTNSVLSCAVPAIGNGLFLDRRSSPPVLSAVLNQISPPSVTYRAIFTFNATTNTWTAPATLPATPPHLSDLIQVHRNGALVDGGYSIAYTPPPSLPAGLQGSLSILPAAPWTPTDTVSAVWVFPFQSINITPTP